MRLISIFFMFAGLILTGLNPAHAETCSKVRVNGTSYWYPVVTRVEGEAGLRGLLPTLAREAFESLGIEVIEMPERPWKRLLIQLEAGKFDVLLGAYRTDARAAKFLYSTPVYNDEVAVFVAAGKEFELTGPEDLIGRKGVRPFGGSYGQAFDAFSDAYLDMSAIGHDGDADDLFRILLAGKADYGVLGRFDGQHDMIRLGLQNEVTQLPAILTVNPVHFLFSKNSPCAALLPRFNAQLSMLLETGRADEVLADLVKVGLADEAAN